MQSVSRNQQNAGENITESEKGRHFDVWPQITFKGQRSRSNPESFEVEYLKNGAG